MAGQEDVTALLRELARKPDGRVADRLLPLVYDELRAIATARLRAERAGHTLSATALVHEVYLKLVDQAQTDWKNRAHFFAIAARAMRRVLLDYAIARQADKRGGGAEVITLAEGDQAQDSNLDDVIAIDDALKKLAAVDPRGARVVEQRFFGGLTLEEIAVAEGDSLSTINRAWRTARAFLTVELRDFDVKPG
jgi:RNA polymerase sigma-70 factor (ECF subfamily)